MSHELLFLPRLLGQTWPEAFTAATEAAEPMGWESVSAKVAEARLDGWHRVVMRAAEVLGNVEEYRGARHAELTHPFTRLRFTLYGGDGVLSLPYWYDGPVARKAVELGCQLARVISRETGLDVYDPQCRRGLVELTVEEVFEGYLAGRAGFAMATHSGSWRSPEAPVTAERRAAG